jgi:hypothetical protein
MKAGISWSLTWFSNANDCQKIARGDATRPLDFVDVAVLASQQR